MRTIIRPEQPEDREAVHTINVAAFESAAEAGLVDSLRDLARPVISLVAEQDGEVVGHIMFSPATLDDHPELRLMGLAPMAVTPALQRAGIGSALVRAGLEECKQLHMDAVIVLGHPSYYPRFGFQPSVRFGIGSEYEAPDEAFMLLELRPGCLRGAHGVARYHEAFRDL